VATQGLRILDPNHINHISRLQLAMDASAERPEPRTLDEIKSKYAQDYFEVSRVCE